MGGCAARCDAVEWWRFALTVSAGRASSLPQSVIDNLWKTVHDELLTQGKIADGQGQSQNGDSSHTGTNLDSKSFRLSSRLLFPGYSRCTDNGDMTLSGIFTRLQFWILINLSQSRLSSFAAFFAIDGSESHQLLRFGMSRSRSPSITFLGIESHIQFIVPRSKPSGSC